MANPERRTDKKDLPLARVTVFLKGETKKKFFNEVERTEHREGTLAKEIIERHYRDK